MRSVLGQLQLTGAIAAARLAAGGSRLAGKGGGTAIPGVIIDRIDPRFVARITSGLPRGVVLVAGTNGKTTTSRLIAAILAESGLKVAHNRTGSNLVRGVAAALAKQSSLLGRLDADVAVIESDEAAMPDLACLLNPRLIVLGNLFRDQLDRYGELNAIAEIWAPVLSRLDGESTLVVNGDDPGLVAIAEDSPARKVYFSVDPGPYGLDELPHAADSVNCARCHRNLRYDRVSLSHLGEWSCPVCAWKRPSPTVLASDVSLDGIESIRAVISAPGHEPFRLDIGIPGLYTVYNATTAVAAALEMDCTPEDIARAASSFSTPFGRLERFEVEGRRLTLALVKNPVAFNETLRMIAAGPAGLEIPSLIAINDLDADGRDISWLWDVDFELLERGTAPVSTTGIRAADMANRLKYAGLPVDRINLLPTDLRAGLYEFVRGIEPGGRGFLLATYTAMLGLRQVLSDDGVVRAYWEE